MEKTFAMIKPRAVAEHHTGKIIDMIETAGFTIAGLKKIHMSREQAQCLYQEHAEKPFFPGMVDIITSTPVVVMVLKKDNAVKAWRDLMGATNPAQADAGTIRALFGVNIDHNATHGSDSLSSAKREMDIFFPEL